MPDFDPFFDEPSGPVYDDPSDPTLPKKDPVGDIKAWSERYKQSTGQPVAKVVLPSQDVPTEQFCPECHIDRGHEPNCSLLIEQIKTLEERAKGQSIVILAKQPRKPWQIYCPACDFMFERTKVAVARTWAVEHNNKKHLGQLKVLDLTQHQDSNPTKVTSPLSW